MAIQHTVVFRLRSDADEGEFLDAARSALIPIPGVQRFSIRRQVSAKSELALQFAMEFEDRAAYDAYDAHPDHRAFVATRWLTEVDEFQEYDFVELDAAGSAS